MGKVEEKFIKREKRAVFELIEGEFVNMKLWFSSRAKSHRYDRFELKPRHSLMCTVIIAHLMKINNS